MYPRVYGSSTKISISKLCRCLCRSIIAVPPPHRQSRSTPNLVLTESMISMAAKYSGSYFSPDVLTVKIVPDFFKVIQYDKRVFAKLSSSIFNQLCRHFCQYAMDMRLKLGRQNSGKKYTLDLLSGRPVTITDICGYRNRINRRHFFSNSDTGLAVARQANFRPLGQIVLFRDSVWDQYPQRIADFFTLPVTSMSRPKV